MSWPDFYRKVWDVMKRWYLIVISLVVCAVSAQCSHTAPAPSQDFVNICDTEPALPLDYDTAAAVQTVLEGSGGLTLAPLGTDAAQELAVEQFSGENFCMLPPSQFVQEALDEVARLAADGKNSEARQVLDDLLSAIAGKGTAGGVFRMPVQSNSRQAVADYLAAAQAEAQAGLGDGQAFMGAAKAAFSDFAGQELQSGGYQDMLNLAKEAAWFGDEQVMQQALERAREMMRQDIDAALEDFDPCLPNPEIVRQDMIDLLKKLETSILLGDQSAASQVQAEAIWAKIGQAIQNHFSAEPIAEMVPPELLDQPLSCCREGVLTVQQLTFTDYASVDIPYTVTTLPDKKEIYGAGQLLFEEPLGDKTYTFDMDIEITGVCSQAQSGNQLVLTINIVGDVIISGTGSGGWPLDDVDEIILPLEDGAAETIIREGAEYRIFILHLSAEQ